MKAVKHSKRFYTTFADIAAIPYHPTASGGINSPYVESTPNDDNRINDVVIDYATNSAPDGNLYTKEDVLIAGEIGEINHYDYKHIASLLAEAREIRLKLNREII